MLLNTDPAQKLAVSRRGPPGILLRWRPARRGRWRGDRGGCRGSCQLPPPQGWCGFAANLPHRRPGMAALQHARRRRSAALQVSPPLACLALLARTLLPAQGEDQRIEAQPHRLQIGIGKGRVERGHCVGIGRGITGRRDQSHTSTLRIDSSQHCTPSATFGRVSPRLSRASRMSAANHGITGSQLLRGSGSTSRPSSRRSISAVKILPPGGQAPQSGHSWVFIRNRTGVPGPIFQRNAGNHFQENAAIRSLPSWGLGNAPSWPKALLRGRGPAQRPRRANPPLASKQSFPPRTASIPKPSAWERGVKEDRTRAQRDIFPLRAETQAARHAENFWQRAVSLSTR